MTNEEAIQEIKYVKDKTGYADKALDMAIEALEQESCEDCISRAELLKAIDTWDKFGCDADTKLVPIKDCYVPYIHYDDVVKAIKGMPSIQPKTDVLDKIRAEIEQVKSIMNEEIIDNNRKDLINFVNGLNQSLAIIDKYKTDGSSDE